MIQPLQPNLLFMEYVVNGRLDKVKHILDTTPSTHRDYDWAVNLAVMQNNISMLQLLIPHLDVNADNGTALITAARFGYTECAKCLIVAGADPRADGGHALIVAIAYSNYTIADLLFNLGAVNNSVSNFRVSDYLQMRVRETTEPCVICDNLCRTGYYYSDQPAHIMCARGQYM